MTHLVKQLACKKLKDFESIGITGEETNKLLCYLACVSSKLDDPLSVLIQSRSAAGKSSLQDAVLSFFPKEEYIRYTRITNQALFYKEENSLEHKVLAIEESEGVMGAAYSIRNIQSSKYLSIAATGKDPVTGKLRTEEYRVKGPVAVLVTTTSPEVDAETASRFLFITIDESKEMTERIHKVQRSGDTLEGLLSKKKADNVIKKHQNAQRLLKPLAVINPFSPYLSFPSDSIQARRDHKKYLSLIKAVAYLHQYQKEIKTINQDGTVIEYIEVTLEDIDRSNKIADEVLGRSLDELSPPSRKLLSIIHDNVKSTCDKEGISANDFFFNRRRIREWAGWNEYQVRSYIRQLVDMEYVRCRMGTWGKEYVYEMAYDGRGKAGERFYLGLTTTEEIVKRIKGNGENFVGEKGYFVTENTDFVGTSCPLRDEGQIRESPVISGH